MSNGIVMNDVKRQLERVPIDARIVGGRVSLESCSRDPRSPEASARKLLNEKEQKDVDRTRKSRRHTRYVEFSSSDPYPPRVDGRIKTHGISVQLLL